MANLEIEIAKDFYKFPAGRAEIDGPYNGKLFRTTLLAPKLRLAIAADSVLVVSFDGLGSCGSSFLDSAFGGLVQEDGFTHREIKSHLRIVATGRKFDRYTEAALRYIEKARKA